MSIVNSAKLLNNNFPRNNHIIKRTPFPVKPFSALAGEGDSYTSFLVNHQASARALMPPVSFPTIMAGSTSGANPAVKPR